MTNRGQRLPMVRLARSSAWNGALAGMATARAGPACAGGRAGPLQLSRGWPRSPGYMLTCGDTKRRPLPRCGGPPGGPGAVGVGLPDHGMNSIEPDAWLLRITGAGRFVQADVPVIGCIRFRTETSWRTMDREASKGRPRRDSPAWKRAEV